MPLRPLLLFVSVVLLVDTSAYATITPLLPGLADEHALDKGEAGILSAAYAAGTLLFAIPAAALAARVGAKRTVLCGLAVLGLASLSFGLAESAPQLIGTRFVQGIGGAATWAGALAWVVAVAPRERRAQALGTAIGAAIFGSLFGPVLGALADAFGTLVVFGAFVALPAALAVWAVRMPAASPVAAFGLRDMGVALRDRRLRGGVWLMALPSVGFGVMNVLVPLRLDALGVGAAVVAGTWLAAAGLESLVAPLAGRAADRHGTLVPARLGLLGGGVLLALLPLPHVPGLVIAGTVCAAAVLGLMWAPAMTLMTAGAERQGIDPAFAFGLANMAWGGGITAGAAAGGALAGATADVVPYLIVATLALGTVLLLRGRTRDPVVAPRARRV